jgi:acetyl esterase
LVFYRGGYVIGDVDTHAYVCRKIASVANPAQLRVDCRLVPAVEDSAAARR